METNACARLNVNGCIETIVRQSAHRTLGWHALDSRGIACGPGDLLVCAGRTGHGKTAALINVLVHWLEAHPRDTFVFFSCELPPEQVFLRLLSIVGRRHQLGEWTYADLRNCLSRWAEGGADGDAASRGGDPALRETLARVSALCERLHVLYRPSLAIEDLEQQARAFAHADGQLGGLFVDYLQLIHPPSGTEGPQEARIQAVSRRMKALGVALDCPTVTAAQIHSSAAKLAELLPHGELEDEAVMEAIGRRRPQLHHLGQGAGEQEADMVVGLLNYQADYLAGKRQSGARVEVPEQPLAGTPYEVTVIKNRHGELGTARLVLEATTGFLRDPGVFGH